LKSFYSTGEPSKPEKGKYDDMENKQIEVLEAMGLLRPGRGGESEEQEESDEDSGEESEEEEEVEAQAISGSGGGDKLDVDNAAKTSNQGGGLVHRIAAGFERAILPEQTGGVGTTTLVRYRTNPHRPSMQKAKEMLRRKEDVDE